MGKFCLNLVISDQQIISINSEYNQDQSRSLTVAEATVQILKSLYKSQHAKLLPKDFYQDDKCETKTDPENKVRSGSHYSLKLSMIQYDKLLTEQINQQNKVENQVCVNNIANKQEKEQQIKLHQQSSNKVAQQQQERLLQVKVNTENQEISQKKDEILEVQSHKNKQANYEQIQMNNISKPKPPVEQTNLYKNQQAHTKPQVPQSDSSDCCQMI